MFVFTDCSLGLSAFFGSGTREETGLVLLKANQSHSLLLQFENINGPAEGEDPTIESIVMMNGGGLTLGGAEDLEESESIAEAAKLAAEADVAVVVLGTNGDWETEGHDRDTLALPGRTDELVKAVVQANERTVVVCQSVCAFTPSHLFGRPC